MKYLMPILMTACLAACVGSSTVKRPIAVYDFGLVTSQDENQRITAKLELEPVTAAEALNYQNMRYRLSYENPARVFFFAESRWASPPAELVSNALNSMLQPAQGALTCRLKLRLDIFDHVFTSPTASEGVVQMNATVVDIKTRRVLSSRVISARSAAAMQNAQGGADALSKANSLALRDVIAWGNGEAEKQAACQ